MNMNKEDKSTKSTNQRRKPQNNKRYQGKGNKTNKDKITTPNEGITSNDIAWWNKSPIYGDVTRVPFNRISGALVSINEINPSTNGILDSYAADLESVPGIMRINFYPVLGPAKDLNSPVNRCMTSLYAGLYSKTTGAMQFSQADMSLEILATDSIVTNIGMVKRVLGLSQLYNGQNMYFPHALISACGIDPKTVLGHQDEIRRKLNTCIQSLNALKLPGYLDIWKRHYQLATNVYADEDDVRAQFYTFVPHGYYSYIEDGMDESISEVAHLKYTDFTFDGEGVTMDVNDLIDIINDQLLKVRHSSSFALISGSMQRAYPDAALLTIGIAGLEDVCIPLIDKHMMWQINNATLVGKLPASTLHMTQDPVQDCLYQIPKVTGVSGTNNYTLLAANRNNFILNSFDGDISPEFIMEATRLMCYASISGASDNSTIEFQAFGTEIVGTGHLYYYSKSTPDSALAIIAQEFQTLNKSNSAEIGGPFPVQMAARATKFRCHPRFEFVTDTRSSLPVGDLYRWTTVDGDTLYGLNEAALQSIYVVNVMPTIK